ncbi:helix-turn-helix domain-containing protein [Salinibacter ruber]|nr:helix-turn-helix domain-containing protein [Salinibacter ruber]
MSTAIATEKLDREELADMLGVTPNTVSGAAHGQFLCRGHAVHEWAVWHPRGNQVRYYEVPKEIIRKETTSK